MAGLSLRRLLTTFSILALAVISFGGCSSASRADLFKNRETTAPHNGRSLDPGAWEKFETVDSKRRLSSSHTTFWFLPFQFSVHDFHVSKDRDKAVSRNVMWNDISTPLLLTALPFHFAFSEYQYEKGSDAPISKSGFRWTLLWANTESRGKETDFKFRAKGIPLFYAFVSARSTEKDMKLSFNHSLWTLGPALLRLKTSDPINGGRRGYFFTPLLLGGALGGILWTDHYVVAEDQRLSLGHGPLFGPLGYWKQRSEWVSYKPSENKDEPPTKEVKGIQSQSGVLLGILWSQYERRDLNGKIDKSRYGPLWTMFGWSHREGRLAIKFLWVPIRF